MKQGDLVFNKKGIPGVVISAAISRIFGGEDAVISVLWSTDTKPKLTLKSLTKEAAS